MNTFKKIATTSCFVVVGLSLGSCELLGPKQAVKQTLAPVAKEQPDVVYKELQNKPPITETTQSKSELYPGTDRFVSGKAPQHRRASPTGAGSYSLNFDEADLGEVAKVILSDILGQNYVLSPKVAGKVTLQTTEPLTKEELLPTLEMVLRMNNAALVKDGRIYHIEPAAEALYSSSISSGRTGYQTRVIPVKNVAVQDIAEILKPLVHEKTILNVDGARNILVASGTADEMARVMDMVSTFDIDVLKGRSFGLFPLAHVDPETVIDELESIFYQKAKAGESEFFQFIPIERLNAVLAVTHQARYLEDIESWVTRLDRANTASGGGVNVYKVQHVDAEELADTLNEIFTGAAKKDKSAKVAPGHKASTMTNKGPTSTGTQPTMPTGNLASLPFNQPNENSSADNAPSGNPGAFALNQSGENSSAGNAPLGNPGAFALNQSDKKLSAGNQSAGDAHVANVGEVKIIADKANNAVVIVSTPREYDTILPVIKQLDIMPLQVLIDASVVSVRLTDNLQYGIEWFLRQGNTAIGSNLGGSALGGIRLGDLAADAATAFATGGLSVVQNSGSVKAILHAQAAKGNVDVISSPSLMVLNNQEAKINVGQQVPISTGSSSVPIAGGATPSFAQSNSIQYKDTGVTLEVTPRVNANGMVIMEIKQIVSSVVNIPTQDSTQTQQQTPTIDKKEIESSVAVLDGETIALGGLIDEQNTENKNGIPWLYQLPLIGPLFGSTKYDKIKNELVVLITPRVVKSKQDSRQVTDEFKRKLTGIYQDVSTYNYEPTMGEEGKQIP
ncbi:MAG: type II secretion system secretin GspD [Methylococcales bacterium]|nr:type II secretion system secretin GspD [Methylococcales bacterium]